MRPSGYVWDMLLAELEDVVGPRRLTSAAEDLHRYAADYFWLPRMWVARGLPPLLPDVAVLPETPEEVSRIVSVANTHGIPVVPWGGGSGSQGGALAIHGGIIVDLHRMNRVLDVDGVSLTVTAQTGINGQSLENLLNEQGLSLPHYPASIDAATLGGYLAARGSGVLSTRYGKAEDMVLSIEVVLPTGEIVRTPPVPSHASGPDLLHLFIGSEGTYGIITEATMRLETLPEVRSFRGILFPDIRTGLEAGRRIMITRLCPSVMRLYDEASTERLLPGVLGLEGEGALMILAVDGFAEFVEIQLQRMLGICKEHGGEDLGPEPGTRWWKRRFDFYKPPHVWDVPKLFGTTDTVCTFRNIEGLYGARKHAIEDGFRDWGAKYFAHFSHWFAWGVMIYDRFLVESPPEDVHEAIRLHDRLWNIAARIALEHGGVLNDHHGVGLKLGRHMRAQYGPGFRVLEGIKTVLDPRGIMNPGKLGFSSRWDR